MRKFLSYIAFAAFISVAPVSVAAQADAEDPDVLDMSLDENINYPEVPKKAKAYVCSAMDQIKRMLIKNGIDARLSREGEVVEFSIPCSSLFATGSLELKPGADKLLQPLGPIVREPGRYKVLVAVHTDDTGDSVYADSISAARANAIDDYYWTIAGQNETNLIPYGIGKDEPLQPNTTILGRNANRRVEFFIIPDQELLIQAGVKPRK